MDGEREKMRRLRLVSENTESPREIKIDESKTINLSIDSLSFTLEIRTEGEFVNRGFRLQPVYQGDYVEWILGKDNTGATILVPVKKD